jgi:glutathione S-transferase
MGAARVLGVLDDRLPNLTAYLARVEARPAYQRASAD